MMNELKYQPYSALGIYKEKYYNIIWYTNPKKMQKIRQNRETSRKYLKIVKFQKIRQNIEKIFKNADKNKQKQRFNIKLIVDMNEYVGLFR